MRLSETSGSYKGKPYGFSIVFCKPCTEKEKIIKQLDDVLKEQLKYYYDKEIGKIDDRQTDLILKIERVLAKVKELSNEAK